MPQPHVPETGADEKAHRDEWIDAVGRLIDEAEEWSKVRSWRTDRQTKTINDDPLGAYNVEQLWINPGRGRTLFLDPTSRFLPGGKGIVDLYLWPDFDGVMIPWTEDGWHVHLPVDRLNAEQLPWSEEAFEKAVTHLIGG